MCKSLAHIPCQTRLMVVDSPSVRADLPELAHEVNAYIGDAMLGRTQQHNISSSARHPNNAEIGLDSMLAAGDRTYATGDLCISEIDNFLNWNG